MNEPPEPVGQPPTVAAMPPTVPVARAAHPRGSSDEYDDRRLHPRPRPSASVFGWSRREGVLPRGKVRLACFAILTLALVVAGTVCILAVWDATTSEVAWKAITSLAIVAAMAAAFTVLNEVFGQRIESSDA